MTDHQKLHDLSEKMNALKEELAVEYDNWMELQVVYLTIYEQLKISEKLLHYINVTPIMNLCYLW